MVRALKWMDRSSIEEIADILPPEWAKPGRNVLLASLRSTKDMPSPDGRFSLETAELAYHVLSTVDPRLRGAKVDVAATFTNRFVDNAHAAIMQK
jgi:NitT/TauT family transport system substrate-binding protein